MMVAVASAFSSPALADMAAAKMAAMSSPIKPIGIRVVDKGIDRIFVGLAMIPRGEVGLVIASIGQSIRVRGEPMIDQATFSAVVVMVVVTTVATPPLLKWRSR